jgi:hypothetical protein
MSEKLNGGHTYMKQITLSLNVTRSNMTAIILNTVTFHQHIQTGYGAQQASYLIGTDGSIHGDKAEKPPCLCLNNKVFSHARDIT